MQQVSHSDARLAAHTIERIRRQAVALSELNLDSIDDGVLGQIAVASQTLEVCLRRMSSSTLIYRLPLEILALIFKIIRDVTNAELWTRPVSTYQSPIFVLSRVCTRWSRVAFAHPTLWTESIHCTPWNFNILRAHLKRSQKCPLDLQIVATMPIVDVSRPSQETCNKIMGDIQSLVDILDDHIPRCRRICILVQQEFRPMMLTLLTFLAKFTDPLPLLQELHIEEYRCLDFDFDPLDPGPLATFTAGAPSGQYLETIKIAAPLGLNTFPLGGHITTLHFRSSPYSLGEFFEALSPCTSLETLALYDDLQYNHSHYWPASRSLKLPSLSSLLFLDTRSVHEIMNIFSAPKLRHLVITRLASTNFTLEEPHFAREQFGSLRKLTLTLDYPSLMEIESLSECFPEVEEITVAGRARGSVFQHLMGTDFEQNPWPKLHTLALRSLPSSRVLQELITVRQSRGTPLRRVYMAKVLGGIRDWTEDGPEMIKRDLWEELWQDGMYYPRHHFGSLEEDLDLEREETDLFDADENSEGSDGHAVDRW